MINFWFSNAKFLVLVNQDLHEQHMTTQKVFFFCSSLLFAEREKKKDLTLNLCFLSHTNPEMMANDFQTGQDVKPTWSHGLIPWAYLEAINYRFQAEMQLACIVTHAMGWAGKKLDVVECCSCISWFSKPRIEHVNQASVVAGWDHPVSLMAAWVFEPWS